ETYTSTCCKKKLDWEEYYLNHGLCDICMATTMKEEKKKYVCFLNGQVYGSGNLRYMHELFYDYVVNKEMYDLGEATFKIVERSKAIKYFAEETMKQNHEALKRLDD